ncbi:MAG: hypothetical protein KAS96_03150, partial [Planctomycetes bacterium]|nr:hypothetical protein [Planctomycetota bacterium]
FYVYIHKDKQTGIPFYVGKGRGKRAHSKNRSGDWHKKIESLPDGYEVVIIKSKISETEAYELENELIEKYGNVYDNSGSLVNRLPGGDVLYGEGLSFNIQLPAEFAKFCEYESDFKDLNEKQQKDFINSIEPKIKELSECYIMILKKQDDEEMTLLQNSVDNFLIDVPKAIKKYNSEKISFREFASYFENYIEDIESDLEKVAEEPQREDVIHLAKSLYDFFNPKLNYLHNE